MTYLVIHLLAIKLWISIEYWYDNSDYQPKNRNLSSSLQNSIFEILIVVPRNLFNSFKLLIGILQYGSPGSPTMNLDIQKISTLNVATPIHFDLNLPFGIFNA